MDWQAIETECNELCKSCAGVLPGNTLCRAALCTNHIAIIKQAISREIEGIKFAYKHVRALDGDMIDIQAELKRRLVGEAGKPAEEVKP